MPNSLRATMERLEIYTRKEMEIGTILESLRLDMDG